MMACWASASCVGNITSYLDSPLENPPSSCMRRSIGWGKGVCGIFTITGLPSINSHSDCLPHHALLRTTTRVSQLPILGLMSGVKE
jgi:hypothetical protein